MEVRVVDFGEGVGKRVFVIRAENSVDPVVYLDPLWVEYAKGLYDGYCWGNNSQECEKKIQFIKTFRDHKLCSLVDAKNYADFVFADNECR